MTDIYFHPEYGKLYEKAEGGTAVCRRYQGPEGVVEHQFILRPIPIDLPGGPVFDLVTPYGYGGPRIVALNPGFSKGDLVRAFERDHARFCARHRVVSEFVRFHPLEGNGPDFASVYASRRIRATVGTNLRDFGDPVAAEFSPGCRKEIRRALRAGVSWRVTPCPESLDTFEPVYRSTLARNQAAPYYDFGHGYFADCLARFREHIVLIEAVYEGKTVAAGLYFRWNGRLHAHLSGTLTEYLHLSPACVVQYAGVVWGKAQGCDLVHRGGGRTDSPDDPLYLFKKKFGCNTEFDFHVGRRVWDEETYRTLCRLRGTSGEDGFFPAYRRGL